MEPERAISVLSEELTEKELNERGLNTPRVYRYYETVLKYTWQAVAEAIRAHIEAVANPDKKDEIYREVGKYIALQYIIRPELYEDLVHALISSAIDHSGAKKLMYYVDSIYSLEPDVREVLYKTIKQNSHMYNFMGKHGEMESLEKRIEQIMGQAGFEPATSS